ncbi:molybdopterin-guanine dinucleotide biosynthesis protein B [Paenibacillus methanolicus]|uniref:Molybdopterin-guanine dinucleotide biosynthesis protein B n=1 Tax=Paenibacillus methanolicus TaxID=582686 RepID=A0A5S5BX47_9BACL|nr:molybdopterin-guanine dinucleotide biosynthesis protein B [Paenibacillus methanolicus]TYP71741.1 molybdopterin-guanine dinucleotide biosynthesis protein B [Paenibacillus methanolicus]
MTPSQSHSPPVLQIIGYKNSGKTTLVAALVRLLKAEGYRVGTVKHDAHDFTMDYPGTDTWQHQEAGADVTAISSSRRAAVLTNRPAALNTLMAHMAETDVVLVEGFKQERYPKLVLIRKADDLPLLDLLANIHVVVIWPEMEAWASGASYDIPIIRLEETASIYAAILRATRLERS